MNVIRKAVLGDLERIIELYDLCFPDEVEFRNWYFKRLWTERTAFVLEKDGEIAAMLQAMPIKMKSCGGVLQGIYIYAAGTNPAYRGQGLMTELLTHVHSIARAEGCALSVLITENDPLIAFYSRLGYLPIFASQSIAISSGAGICAIKAESRHIPQIIELYEKMTENRLSQHRTEGDISLQLELFGDNAYVAEIEDKVTAYAFLDAESKRVIEGAGQDIDRLCREIGAEVRIAPATMGNDSAMGCALPLSSAGEMVLKSKLPPYLNLLFN